MHPQPSTPSVRAERLTCSHRDLGGVLSDRGPRLWGAQVIQRQGCQCRQHHEQAQVVDNANPDPFPAASSSQPFSETVGENAPYINTRKNPAYMLTRIVLELACCAASSKAVECRICTEGQSSVTMCLCSLRLHQRVKGGRVAHHL